jgi:hypothetical protein
MPVAMGSGSIDARRALTTAGATAPGTRPMMIATSATASTSMK